MFKSIYRGKDIPNIIAKLFYGHTIQSKVNTKAIKSSLDREYFEEKGGSLSVTFTNSKSCNFIFENKRVYNFVYIDSRAESIITDSNFIELDCTFYSVKPYAICVPFAIIQNESLPLGISLSTSEKHEVFRDFYDLFIKAYGKSILEKPVLSDEGTALKKFINDFKDEELIHFFCFRHITEKFGASTTLGKLVNDLLFTYSVEEFIEKWQTHSNKIAIELQARPDKVDAIEMLFKCKYHDNKLSEPNIAAVDQLIWIRKKYGVATCSNHCEGTHAKYNKDCRDIKKIEDRLGEILKHNEERFSVFYARRNLKDKLDEYNKLYDALEDSKKNICKYDPKVSKHCKSMSEFYSALYGIPFPCVHTIKDFKCPIYPLKSYQRTQGLKVFEIKKKSAEQKKQHEEEIKKTRTIDEIDLPIPMESDTAEIENEEEDDEGEDIRILSVVLKNYTTNDVCSANVMKIDINNDKFLDVNYPKLILPRGYHNNEVFIPNSNGKDYGEYVIERCLIIDENLDYVIKKVRLYICTVIVEINGIEEVKGVVGYKMKNKEI